MRKSNWNKILVAISKYNHPLHPLQWYYSWTNDKNKLALSEDLQNDEPYNLVSRCRWFNLVHDSGSDSLQIEADKSAETDTSGSVQQEVRIPKLFPDSENETSQTVLECAVGISSAFRVLRQNQSSSSARKLVSNFISFSRNLSTPWYHCHNHHWILTDTWVNINASWRIEPLWQGANELL